MPAVKYTMIFQYVSGGQEGTWSNIPGGWSESFYWGAVVPPSYPDLRNFLAARAALLPDRCQMIGLRINQVDPVGVASTRKLFLVGSSPSDLTAQDIPQSAVLFTATGVGVANVVRKRLAAMPDGASQRGEWVPSAHYRSRMTTFLRELDGWWFRGRDLTAASKMIGTVDANGVYVLLEDQVLTAGQMVNVNQVRDSDGEMKSGKFKVAAYVNSKNGTLRNWTFGATTLGRITPYTIIYPVIVSKNLNQNTFDMVARKIGRPSKRYVGRRRKSRS